MVELQEVTKCDVQEEKLKKLKLKIEARQTELLNEMSSTIKNRQMTHLDNLDKQKLQCDAEIRLINHILNNFEGEFVIS